MKGSSTEGGLEGIRDVFRGARILITGGTGFMGQLLMEKLLRECHELDRVYVLARAKKGKTETERLDKILDDAVYSRVKVKYPNFKEKVFMVKGDCQEQGLGISEEDRSTLIQDVNIIFHAAATVRFDAKLKAAHSINVLGTKTMLELAHSMPNLKAFVHISTAYSHCTRMHIEEKIYPIPLKWREVGQLIDSLDEETLDIMTPHILGDWPNSYSFTKAVTEDLIRDCAKDLPIAILRPSIVAGTAKEPLVHWLNNIYGPAAAVAGGALGVIHSIYCNPDLVADLVPADMAINATIAVAWAVVESRRKAVDFLKDENELVCDGEKEPEEGGNIPVYNFISSKQNPMQWNKLFEYNKVSRSLKSVQSVWYCFFMYNKYKIIHNVYITLFHLFPALLVDTAARIIGRKPMLWNIYQKIHKYIDLVAYFAVQQWEFNNSNTLKLWAKMSPQDQKMFWFNIEEMDWSLYIYFMLRGMRLYVYKESFDTIPEGDKIYRRLTIMHFTLLYIIEATILYYSYPTLLRYLTYFLEALEVI